MEVKNRLTLSQQELGLALFHRGAIKFGAFRLKLHEKHPEAPPIYVSLRTPDSGGPLTKSEISSIGEELFRVSTGITFDLIAGIPRAGEPFAEVMSILSSKHLLRLGKRQEGDRRKIDAIIDDNYQTGQRVLLVDDLITQADTKKEAIAVCEGAGLVVAALAVLIDREQGGSEELRKAGYEVRVAFTITNLLDYYVLVSAITRSKRNEVLAYIAANR